MNATARLARLTRAAATALLAGIALVGVAACTSDSTRTAAPGPGAAASAEHLDVAAFSAAASKPGTVLVDVRTPAEFAAGHLANAVNIDVQSPDFAQRIAVLEKGSSYALYCHSGNRSGVALREMQSAGFGHVVDLAGGITAWSANGSPVVTGP
ncbi:MAG: rhodanese-like domain-containing protein [Actinobacteria bacterium]|nr:rhodanese-like domain-containing protein [Actinomycetota bacterium]